MPIKAVSSAKAAVVTSGKTGKSDVYSKYNMGDRTLSCGTPAFMSLVSEYSCSCFIQKVLSEIYEVNISTHCFGNILLSLQINPLCQTLTKA